MILNQTQYYHNIQALDKLGFCTLTVFDSSEIEQLKTLYQNNFGSQDVKNLYATHNSNPIEQSLQVSNQIQNMVSNKLLNVFPEYTYFTGHFMVKAANANHEFALHQDWNIVDESKYKSYQIWIPLLHTYPANGGMFVVPGSHKFFNNYRSGSFDIPRIPFVPQFKPIVTDLRVPTGDILIYQNALFHGSYGNTTNDNRVVVIANFVEKHAPTFYFHKSATQGLAELYPITGETLIRNLPQLEKGGLPASFTSVGTLPVGSLNNAAINADDVVINYNKFVSDLNLKTTPLAP
jgi:ectoine hydroxylase-related dioxygenase (phytanoyl-CoA dioxygenase family)